MSMQRTQAFEPVEKTMQVAFETNQTFQDRRAGDAGQYRGPERRQFTDSRENDREEVRELAEAVDQYKLMHRRRFITYEELFNVIDGLGYHK